MMRVAWFVPSGVAPPESPMHIPALTELAEMISDRLDLTVFSFSDRVPANHQRLDVPVRYLPVSWRAPAWRRAVTLWSSFIDEHRREPFDILHGFWALPCGLLAATFGRVAKAKSVSTFLGGEAADVPEIRYGNLHSWWSRTGVARTCRYSSAVHLLTEFQRASLAKHGLNIPHQHVFPLGVDIVRFRPEKKKLAPPYRFLHVANLTEVKDQETLLKAFRFIVDRVPAALRIVGPDHMNGSLQKMAATLGIADSIEFKGFAPHKSLPAHYRWAHVYLQSSLYEGQGVAVLEAMASGAAVCGTRVGILAELPSSCAATVESRHPEELAAAALALLNPKKFNEMTRHARRWTEDHSLLRTRENILNLYQTLAS